MVFCNCLLSFKQYFKVHPYSLHVSVLQSLLSPNNITLSACTGFCSFTSNACMGYFYSLTITQPCTRFPVSVCVPKWFHQFTFLPAMNEEGYSLSTFLPTLIILCVCVFNFSHPSGPEVIPCGIDLHFPNEWWCWISLHMLIGRLYVFFVEMSIQVLYPFFFNWVICLLAVEL